MRLDIFAGAVPVSAQHDVRHMPADRIETLGQIAAQIIDGANGKERVDGLQDVQLILDVAVHHLAAADIESALLPGRFEGAALPRAALA